VRDFADGPALSLQAADALEDRQPAEICAVVDRCVSSPRALPDKLFERIVTMVGLREAAGLAAVCRGGVEVLQLIPTTPSPDAGLPTVLAPMSGPAPWES